MDALNKIVFLILGLAAVVILFAVLSGKIDLKNKFPKLSDAQKRITPTIIKEDSLNQLKKTTAVKSTTSVSKTNKNSTTSGKTVKSIPATGVETAFIPLTFILIAAGFYLKRKSQ